MFQSCEINSEQQSRACWMLMQSLLHMYTAVVLYGLLLGWVWICLKIRDGPKFGERGSLAEEFGRMFS